MKARWLALILAPVALFAVSAMAADDRNHPLSAMPPVMRNFEQPDSVIVRLPGPPPDPATPAPPALAPNTGPKNLDEARPLLRRIKREYPPGFEEDSPKYLQEKIGKWREFDVRDLLSLGSAPI